MSWLKDTLAGRKPTYNQFPGSEDREARIRAAGDVGIGKAARWAKKDVRAAREGRIEEMGRLRPVLTLLKSREGAAIADAERQIRTNTAFEGDPYGLNAQILNETAGRINRNTADAFAGAAAGAYSDAEAELEGARRFSGQMKLQSEIAAGNQWLRSWFDETRQGGILGDLIKNWLNPDPLSKLIGGSSKSSKQGSLSINTGGPGGYVPGQNPGGGYYG